MTIEYVLEILSGCWSILSICFLVFLISYLVGQYRENKLTANDLWSLPLGMVVAVSLVVQNFGSLTSRLTIWIWRHFYTGTPLSMVELYALALSAFVAGIGTLMLIRVFSKPRYGDFPWIFSAAITAAYILGSIMMR